MAENMLLEFRLKGVLSSIIRLYTKDEKRIIECERYMSRSGAHWDECYSWNRRREWQRLLGPVRKENTVMTLEPAGSPDDGREAKNAFSKWLYDYAKELATDIAKNIDYREEQLTPAETLVLRTTHNGAELFWGRKWDYIAIGDLIDYLGSVKVYRIDAILNKHGETGIESMDFVEYKHPWRKHVKFDRATYLGGLYVIISLKPSANLAYIKFVPRRTRRYAIDAVIVNVPPYVAPQNILLMYVNGGKKELLLDAGLYLFLQLTHLDP